VRTHEGRGLFVVLAANYLITDRDDPGAACPQLTGTDGTSLVMAASSA